MHWSRQGWSTIVWYIDLLLTITDHDSGSDQKNTSFRLFQMLSEKKRYSTAELLN